MPPYTVFVWVVLVSVVSGQTLTSVNPNTSPTDSTLEITLTGTTFTAGATITVGTFTCGTPTFDSTTQYRCTVPAGAGGGLDVAITTGGVTATLTSGYSYKVPTISTVTTSTTAGAATTVTIQGSNFGLTHTGYSISSVSPTFSHPTVGAISCVSGTVVRTTATEIQCTAMSAQGNGSVVTVTSYSQASSNTLPFTFAAPVVTAVSAVSSGGGVVTVTGQELGSYSGDVKEIYLESYPNTNSFKSCTTPTLISNTQWSCTAGAGFGSGLTAFVVGYGGVISPHYTSVFSYTTPTISSVTKGNTAGGVVTVSGLSFGAQQSDITQILINGTECTTPTFLSYGLLSCVVQAGTGNNYTTTVSIMNTNNTQYSVYSYKAPTVTSVPRTTTTGASVVMSGLNFGSAGSTVAVTINGTACTTPAILSDSTLTCVTAAGSGKGLTVLVTTDAGVSATNNAFSYKTPTVATLTPQFATSTGHDNITISGSNFGPGGLVSITVGNDLMPCHTMEYISHTQLLCGAPANGETPLPKNLVILVTVNGQTSANETAAWMRYRQGASVNVYWNGGNGTTLPEYLPRTNDIYINITTQWPLTFVDNTTLQANEKYFVRGFAGNPAEPNGFNKQMLAKGFTFSSGRIEYIGINSTTLSVRVVASESINYDIFTPEYVNLTIPAVLLSQDDSIDLGTVIIFLPETSAHVANRWAKADSRMIRNEDTTFDITLVNTTWVEGSAFDAQRQNILDGITVAQQQLGVTSDFIRLYKPTQWSVSGVVRVDNTTVKITSNQLSGYFITGDENITCIVPAGATLSAQALHAYAISPSERNVTIKHVVEVLFDGGSILNRTKDNQGSIVAGGATLGLTVWGVKWVSGWTTTIAQNVLKAITGSLPESTGWNNQVKTLLTSSHVQRLDDFHLWITFPAAAGYAITTQYSEYLNITVPTSAVTCDAASTSRRSCTTYPGDWATPLSNVNSPLRIRSNVEIYINGSHSRPSMMVSFSDPVNGNVTTNGHASPHYSCERYVASNSSTLDFSIHGHGFKEMGFLSWHAMIDFEDATQDTLNSWNLNTMAALMAERNITATRSDLSEIFNSTVQSLEYIDWVPVVSGTKTLMAPIHKINETCLTPNGWQVDSFVRVVESGSNLAGSFYYWEPMKITDSWTVEFDFRITETSRSCLAAYQNVYLYEKWKICNEMPSEGFAFVFQNVTASHHIPAAASNSSGLGYEGLYDAFAVEVDLFNNHNHLDLYQTHISVHKGNKTHALSADQSRSLGYAYTEPITVNATHKIRIVYDKAWSPQTQMDTGRMTGTETLASDLVDGVSGTLSVYMDEWLDPLPRLILPVNFDLWFADYLNGYAFIGFTGRTGGYWSAVDILSLKWSTSRT